MGYGGITERRKSFTEGVELVRTRRYGDTWYLKVYLQMGDVRFRSLKTTELQEAQEKAFEAWRSLMREVERAETIKVSLTRLFHFFIENEQKQVDLGKLNQKTVSSKKSGIINGILPYLAEKRLKNPKKLNANRDFRGYPDWRLAQGKDPSTVNNEIITIKEAFRWFRREDYIDYDAPYIESCRVNQRKRDQSNPPITADDFLVVKDWLNNYVESVPEWTGAKPSQRRPQGEPPKDREKYMRMLFRSYVLITTNAALRPHEWRSLTWGMVKTGATENEINIPPETKTGRRVVFIKGDELKKWKKSQKKLTSIPLDDCSPLGMDPNTGLPISHATYTSRWKVMMKELGMKYTEYSMRAGGICSRLEHGVPIFAVARWAGTSVRVIEENYTASIMRSSPMKRQVMKDSGEKWAKCGLIFGSSEDYVIRDLA